MIIMQYNKNISTIALLAIGISMIIAIIMIALFIDYSQLQVLNNQYSIINEIEYILF
jgi:hypothetical protein